MPAVNRSGKSADDNSAPSAEAETEAVAEAESEATEETKPANPLEAIRRAQANRSLPPTGGGRGGRGGGGKGANPQAPRMYNRHK
ncbi:hypothetical protein [Dactylosporangium sp. CA-139066]|uniref:hypothetical protein n=1 Tax=Dactylosporangium sp. CA-139066 TaxID=3239930 RepID=UPI003D8DD8DD